MHKTIRLGKWLVIEVFGAYVTGRVGKRTFTFGWNKDVIDGLADGLSLPEAEWWAGQKKFFQRQVKDIRAGKRSDPLMMTPAERREATKRVSRKMKWSKTFVEAMTTPLALQALENGGSAKGLLPTTMDCVGHDVKLSPEQLVTFKGMTRADFKRLRQQSGCSIGDGKETRQ